METRQRVNDAEAFLAAVRKEQARFIEALGQAAAMLGRESIELERSFAAQTQLTRQFLDAQRSILQLRADTDKELAVIGTVPGELIHSLDPTSVPSDPTPQPVAVDPNDLRFKDGGSSEAFVEFWAERESAKPVVEAPRRWRAQLRAAYPVAAVASLLTVAMAWMG